MRAFFTLIMGYEGVFKLSKGISKVPIITLKNVLPGIMEIRQYNAYQCVV